MSEQIALIEVPIRDITDARNHRLVHEIGRIDVLGNLCRVMSTGRHLEFWVGHRQFEISLEDLAQTAGAAIAGHLKGEIADRVRAGYSGETKPRQRAALDARADGSVTRTPAEPFP